MKFKLNNINYKYNDGYLALDNVNAEFVDKNFVVILGGSGSGKTTLLKVIAGLLDPIDGSIELDDKDFSGLETSSRDLAMVFQNFVLYPHLTIYHNVMMGLNGFALSEEEKDIRVKDILTEFGLRNYLNFKPRHLSGGQKQRVCIAKALIREPSLFLMDEPLANLDIPQRNKIKVELKNVFNKYNSSFIYATHDINDALFLSTLIWIMDNGRIVQQGNIESIRKNPKSIKVMRLVYGGNINEYDVHYDGKIVKNDAFSFAYKANKAFKNAKLAFSFNDVTIEKNGEITAEVLSLKMLPNGLLLNAKLKDDTLISCIVDEDVEYEVGDILQFKIKLDKIHLFNSKSNKVPR